MHRVRPLPGGRVDSQAMTRAESNLLSAFAAIDTLNKSDPVLEADGEGTRPRDYLYGIRMTAMLDSFCEDPSEALQLAVRSQHLGRHQIPRDSYPLGRAGYHRWRNTLKTHQSSKARAILSNLGYGEETLARVTSLIEKRKLRSDPEAQTLEDVACLVFLQHYLEPFADSHPNDKTVGVLAKTWPKMSEKGQSYAMNLPLSERGRALLDRALRATPADRSTAGDT